MGMTGEALWDAQERPATHRNTWLALAIALTLLIAASVAVLSVVRHTGWCERAESKDYPALEASASSALRSVPHTTSRVSACEETGRPGARVDALVEQRNSRDVVDQYFGERGWKAAEPRLRSPDGETLMQIVESRQESGETFIRVSLSAADG